ncbi:MAG: FAD-binding protein [Deltaproteobacteria bacterium]|nr:FAD-binding protein [Deltaproteobacteria bacterium]
MPDVKSKLEQLLGPRRALYAPEAIERYATDESGLGAFPPDVVALPESTGEVIEVLRLAALDRISVTPRGLGTGMTGGALAVEGGILLSLERLNRVKELDPENLLAVVEPGVITGELQAQVEAQGLFYPPDPASLASCSLGGNVAENAGGPRAFKYGVTREYVLGLELVRMGGQRLFAGRRTVKGVTGFDLVALVVGSEGTLAVVSEITLKLLPKPQAVATFLARFADVVRAGAAVSELIRLGFRPRTLELMDQHVVEHLRLMGRFAVPAGRSAFLLVELDGDATGLDAQLDAAAAGCERLGAQEILVATDEVRRRQLWEMRRMASPSLKERHKVKVSEDIVVPRAAIPEILRRLDALAVEHDLTIATFGHAGDGNLHVNLLADDEARRGTLEPVLESIFKNALELGGTLSGEHGIGLAKRRFMPLEQPPELLELQRSVKRVFDPEGLLNPGKLFP